MNTCPCGSNISYNDCCEPIIKGERKAKTAEELMRSRYSAYAKKEFEYLYSSLYPDTRSTYDEKATKEWANNTEWQGLTIVQTTKGQANDEEGLVEFIASYKENGKEIKHRELSSFKKKDGIWYFVDGRTPPIKQRVRETPKIGRNDPCFCGSGKKFKKCCGNSGNNSK